LDGSLLLLGLAVVAAAWWAMTGETPVRYTTAPMTMGPISRNVTATGTVNPVLNGTLRHH
jgi:HlyD family secretion protein